MERFSDQFSDSLLLLPPMVPLRESYVYVYTTLAGTPKYVGKGTGKRAESHLKMCFGMRPTCKEYQSPFYKWLRRVVRRGRYRIEYVATGLTDDEAYAFEGDLIEKIGLNNLLNQTVTKKGTKHFQKPVFAIPYSLRGNQHSEWSVLGKPRLFHSPRHAVAAQWADRATDVTSAANGGGGYHHGGVWLWSRSLGRLGGKNRDKIAPQIAQFYVPEVREDVMAVLLQRYPDAPLRNYWKRCGRCGVRRKARHPCPACDIEQQDLRV